MKLSEALKLTTCKVQNREQRRIELVTLRPIDVRTEDAKSLVGKRAVYAPNGIPGLAGCPFSEGKYPIIFTIKKVSEGGYKHWYLKGEPTSTGGGYAWDACLLETD